MKNTAYEVQSGLWGSQLHVVLVRSNPALQHKSSLPHVRIFHCKDVASVKLLCQCEVLHWYTLVQCVPFTERDAVTYCSVLFWHAVCRDLIAEMQCLSFSESSCHVVFFNCSWKCGESKSVSKASKTLKKQVWYYNGNYKKTHFPTGITCCVYLHRKQLSESGRLHGEGKALAELQLHVYFPLQSPPPRADTTLSEVMLWVIVIVSELTWVKNNPLRKRRGSRRKSC